MKIVCHLAQAKKKNKTICRKKGKKIKIASPNNFINHK